MLKSNRTLILIILSVFLLCMGFFNTTNICKVFANSTDLNETTATIKVTTNDETSYYENFSDAANNAPKNSTLVLLKDTDISTERSKTFTIDLNGKTLSNDRNQFSNSTITIIDNVGSGKITGVNFAFYSSRVTVSAGEIDQLVVTDNSTGTILGGKINKLYPISKNLNVSGGEINNLVIYDIGYIHLSGGTINNFLFVGISENFNMLEKGYTFASKNNNTPIKIADMTASTQVNIIKCPHPTFTNYLCDYCGYACEHVGHFNSNGICDDCAYVCPHENVDEDKKCLKCDQQIIANLKNSSTSKNYIKFEDAISAIQSGDILTIYNNINTTDYLEINTPCTMDLNGYSAGDRYIKLNSSINVIDSKGNGFIAITSSSTSSQIKLNGEETTKFLVRLHKNKLKFYSGQILALEILDGTIDNILPEGYVFVEHNIGSNKLTKQETNVSNFATTNSYLTCEICTHDLIDDTLTCDYCNSTLSQEQALESLSKNLQTAKEDLKQAINKKEDITTINEKVNTLNESITNIETICKAYTDEKKQQLKLQLENIISSAKQEAIVASSEALELAKNELLNIINEKLDIEKFNLKVLDLTNAITNAETSSKLYTDSQNSALKTELQNKIIESKTTMQNVNNEIIERLFEAEKEIENNAKLIENNSKSIKSLKVTIIVLFIVFAISMSIVFIVLIKKKLYWYNYQTQQVTFVKKDKDI